MSLNSARSNLTRTQSAIAVLTKKAATLAKKEADITAKLNKAAEGANKAKTSSALRSKLREAERAQNDLARVQKERADVAKSIVNKRKDEHRHQEALSKEEAKERKKEADAIVKVQKEQQRRQSELSAQMQGTMRRIAQSASALQAPEYDVFISHASEDKVSFVDGLARELRSRGLAVWYDNFTLKWGDKLRREIDRGLGSSRFGIVVLSKGFFEKQWPQEELDGLYQMENAQRTRILPIWHDITKDEIEAQSPLLASRLGLNTAISSTREIADQLEIMVNETKA